MLPKISVVYGRREKAPRRQDFPEITWKVDMDKQAGLMDKLNEDLREAMKSGDATRRTTLRLLLAAVKNTEIARQALLADADIFGVISKEIKQRRESIESFQGGNRPDLAAKEEAELAILQAYLPRQAPREEVVEAARRIIQEVGAKSMADKGKVMPRLIAEFKGKADGRDINQIVTELLST